MSSTEQCLQRLGTSQSALVRRPDLFLDRIAARDVDRFQHVIATTTPDVSLDVTLYDDDNRPRREQLQIGTFIEFVGSSRENEVGIIVGCLSLNKAGLLLVVPLDTDDDDVARLPAPDADCIVVETSRVVGKINVENKPAAERPLLKDGFVLAAGASFFGLDAQGTHPLGSFRAPICSLARARRGEMFAATVDSKLVSFDPVHGKVKEVASLRLVAGSNDDSAPPPLFVRGLCFAEGKPAQMDSGKIVAGASQMYCVGKEAAATGDCICTLAPASGKCQIVAELGRRDVVGLAVVPIRASPNEPRNAWSLTGPSDADANAMRFIVWTERGGLFVIDDKRRTLQQLGGDLVRSLRVTSICFDSAGELYAAGKANLYHVSAAGRVTDAAPLEHLPAIVDAVCAAPPSVTNPDDGRTGSPRKSIFAAVVPTRLRFFRTKKASQDLSTRSASFSGRRSSADGLPPVLPVEGMSRGEMKRPADAPRAPAMDRPRPPSQQRAPPAPAAQPYFPDDGAAPRPPSGPPPPLPPSAPPPASTARAPSVRGAGMTVERFLESIGMQQYLGDFEREDLLDLVLLRAMAEDEAQLKEMLKEIGVAKMGHREVIAKALRQQ